MTHLPRLSEVDAIAKDYLSFINALRESKFSGDIETSYASRFSVATDNSIYQTLPQAVILPKNTQDLKMLTKLASKAEFQSIRFSARGGGTGTNGQSLTSGIMVDLSRHMNQIIDFNAEEGWVKVQAGVVKDQLNAFLKPNGFFFAPDLSTSNRATIGGMINTDASGQGSLVYGKTSDHVLGLKSILVDGTELDSSKLAIEDAKLRASQDNTIGRIYKQLLETGIEKRTQILDKFPRLNRFLTGYDLENIFNDELTEFDLSRVITGSEGSLAFVAEAKLNVTPIAKYKALVNVKYDSFDSALRNSPFLVQAHATSVETIDSTVLNLAREDIIWHSVSHLIEDVPNKVMDGINIVEFNANDKAEIEQKINALCQRLDEIIEADNKGVIGYQVTYDLPSIQTIYAMRKKAVGLLGNTKGKKKPLAFAEDTAVPPENLADFIVEFRALLDNTGLAYGMFGHVDAGVLHVRPALDMCEDVDEKLLREISDKVVALTAKYGGLMWGEHGKGFRSEYGPEFFGEELFTELRKIKASFDPNNRMNPGKICTPIDSDENLVSVDDTKRGFYDKQIPITVRESVETAVNCNGNGLCFNWETSSPMCPSYKVTRDRRHSPKGRAGLMREWLRQLSNQGVDFDKLETKLTSATLSAFEPIKQLFTKKSRAEYDYSHEVMQSMDECLACKACTSACPIKVDVPTFRARFLQVYYSRYRRPLKDFLVGSIEQSAPLMAKAPRFVNAIVDNPISKGLLKKTLGYVDTPLLSYPTLEDQVGRMNVLDWDLARLSAMAKEQRSKIVAIVQDPFTSFYDANVVADWVKLITKLGYTPLLLPFKPNGKPEHVKGFLAKFAKTAKDGADFLSQVQGLGITLVGTDPSLVLCYRDEYVKTLGEGRGDFDVLLPHEWLSNIELPQLNMSNKTYQLFAHCSEKTAIPTTHALWQQVFQKFGAELKPISVGCCGMAGTYGHEASHLGNSKALYEMSWQDNIKQFDNSEVLVTGYSCRSQVKRFEQFKPKHPVQALLQLF
ncbi:FAD-binding oxidoreductase [Catenovulum sp. SM1970]|uniref:D-2-hydroxyglutarate dehydrogenase YdiJ n=1 Tax=Marinifaba aquimaris TaxID=2741323 RepID=UPI00157271DE|nr:FAD-binding and (Fe-S)-binding domain-containing protein [Marinifaba aquimaris]NTS76983.1 FAD-binding oxidoreductase [Marinifaba aquimaris]